jgi:hypothetical protein
MCSNAARLDPAAELAGRLAAAIDSLAAASADDGGTEDGGTEDGGTGGGGTGGADLASRLASAWAMIAAADPELAARTARYSRS